MNENNPHPPEDWWTDDLKALVSDVSSVWARKAFKTMPGVWIPVDGGGRLLKKLSNCKEIPENGVLDNSAWDHEHCALCWQKISEYSSDHHEGYTDGDNWLCIECYDKYIGEL